MSTAILNALSGLDDVIDRLEQNMARREKETKSAVSKKSGQPDLFSVPQPRTSGTVVTLDSAVLARKLDVAISRVEELLKEG
ncbi:hypothetical protein [Micavibrio aeruginosavorus]|uniref:hypothetical protein n=1 Tax=Micavibrio aeruginosavorus TaxID=349221 RepID=UPI001F22DF45|nr:hypothetical protein [Micavibrio aeruginosavorus]